MERGRVEERSSTGGRLRGFACSGRIALLVS